MPAKKKTQEVQLQAANSSTKRSQLDWRKFSDRFVEWMDILSEKLHRRSSDELADPDVKIARGPMIFGFWMLFTVFGVFGTWMAFAPLDSAAVAMGIIVPDANKKTIQHLEGGIIEEILVKEGQTVEAGQTLLKLDETAAKARVELVHGQFIAEKATIARLEVERDGKEEITFPKDLLDSEEPKVQEIIESQQKLFEARKSARDGQVSVLKQRIEQSKEEITGLRAQAKSAQKQISLLNEEIQAVQKLLAQGNASKPRLLALQRQASELAGRRGEHLALISRAQQTITQTEVEILNVRNDHLKEVVDQLRVSQVELAKMTEQLYATQDILNRVEIKAPQAGIVNGLKFHTRGGVIAPGETVMDIVPQDDTLVVDARVSTQDIDVVHQGLLARVRLTAYKTRDIPPVEGTVTQVSADRFVDEISGEAYYSARVAISEENLSRLEGVELYPGMPAEVLIVTGSRTMLSYLVSPITDSFFRAFREQ